MDVIDLSCFFFFDHGSDFAHFDRSEVLLLVVEAELVALLFENFAELWRTAEEDGHLALSLLADLLEYLVPVGPAGVRPCL